MYTGVTQSETSPNFNPGAAGEECDNVASWWRPRRALPALAGLLLFAGAFLVVARTNAARGGPFLGQFSNVEELFETDTCKDFAHASLGKVVHNNVGNYGPDSGAEGIVYEGLFKKPGMPDQTITMVLNAITPFQSYQKANGMEGAYAMVGVKGNTSVRVKIRFFDKETSQQLAIPGMRFSIQDFDTHQTGNEVEYVKVWGWKSYVLTKNTNVKVSFEDSDTVKFTATLPGIWGDHAKDAYLLTSDQKNKVVDVLFQDASEFILEFGSFDIVNNGIRNHRHFFITPEPALLCAETQGEDTTGGILPYAKYQPTTTTTMTTATPYTAPTVAPTVAPTLMPTVAPTVTAPPIVTTSYNTATTTTKSGSSLRSCWCWFIILSFNWFFVKF